MTDDDHDDHDDDQGICDILVPGEFITDDTLTILCEMTLPGNDVTKLGYTYNAEVGSARCNCSVNPRHFRRPSRW